MTGKNHVPRKYLDVILKLREQIEKGEFVDKLPGERVLAKQFGYSYLTIRHAITELVADGTLYKVPRKGTFISKEIKDGSIVPVVGFYLHKSYVSGITDPYYALLLKHLQHEAEAKGLHLLYFNDIDDRVLANIDAIVSVVYPDNREQLLELSTKIPIVLLGEGLKETDVATVNVNNYEATVEAVEYAVELGHREIGYIAGPQTSEVARERLRGYVSVLIGHSIPVCDDLIYYGDWGLMSGYDAAQHFHYGKIVPTFIHCGNDLMAMGLIKGVAEMGIGVPDDLSVSGFDNIEEGERYLPSITTMAVDYKQLAQAALNKIVDLIKRTYALPLSTIVPAELCVRDSTTQMIIE